jgi:hypothetical protein
MQLDSVDLLTSTVVAQDLLAAACLLHPHFQTPLRKQSDTKPTNQRFFLQPTSQASKESSLEKALAKMKADWRGVAFRVVAFKDTGTFVIGGTDDVQVGGLGWWVGFGLAGERSRGRGEAGPEPANPAQNHRSPPNPKPQSPLTPNMTSTFSPKNYN